MNNITETSPIEKILIAVIVFLVIVSILVVLNKKKLERETPFFTIKSSGEKLQNYPFSDKKCMEGVVYLVGSGKSITYTAMVDSNGKPLNCSI